MNPEPCLEQASGRGGWFQAAVRGRRLTPSAPRGTATHSPLQLKRSPQTLPLAVMSFVFASQSKRFT